MKLFKAISILGLGVIPNKRRKTDEKNYERTVNRHILKMRFLRECIYTCPACQVSERLKIGAKWQAEFASVYTFALLAKNVIALKYQAYQQLSIYRLQIIFLRSLWQNDQSKLKTEQHKNPTKAKCGFATVGFWLCIPKYYRKI